MSQGAAPSLAAAHERLTGRLWGMLGYGLLCPPLGLLYAISEWGRAILTATAASEGEGWPGLRMLTRALGLLVGLIPLTLVLFDPSVHSTAWVIGPPMLMSAFLAVFSAWIIPLTRPDSVARRSVLRRLGVLLVSLAVPIGAALSWSHNPGAMVYALTILAPILVVPQVSGLLGVFAGTAGPAELLVMRLTALLQPQLSVQPRPLGLEVAGVLEGQDVAVSVDLQRIPAVVTVQVDLPPALSGLSVRARGEGEPGGAALTDMLLSQLLVVEGTDQADALLDGLHEQLLPVLHAWPDATVAGGVLRVRIDLLSASTITRIPDLLAEAARLVAALSERTGQLASPHPAAGSPRLIRH